MRWIAAALIVLTLAAGGCTVTPDRNVPIIRIPVFHF